MACHGHAKSTRTQCSCKCTISSHAVHALCKPFHLGCTCVYVICVFFCLSNLHLRVSEDEWVMRESLRNLGRKPVVLKLCTVKILPRNLMVMVSVKKESFYPKKLPMMIRNPLLLSLLLIMKIQHRNLLE